jgi:hypothetical protein
MKQLYQALAQAQKDLTKLGKKGKGNRSKYVKCDDVIAASRECLLGAGLLPLIVNPRLEELATSIDNNGEVIRQLVLCRTLEIVHLETGKVLSINQRWPVVTDKRMPLDHATAAADSFGLTYLFRGLLLFERGEEDDKRVHGEPREESRPAPAPKPKPKPPTVTKEAKAFDSSTVAATLTKSGWVDSILPGAEIEAAYNDEVIPRQMLRDLYSSCVEYSGKDRTLSTWKRLGVVPGETKTINGAKCFELALSTISTIS